MYLFPPSDGNRDRTEMTSQRRQVKIGNEAECAYEAPSGHNGDSGSRNEMHNSTLSAALKVASTMRHQTPSSACSCVCLWGFVSAAKAASVSSSNHRVVDGTWEGGD